MNDVQMIAIAKIRVLNPRARNKAKFGEIVTNVSKIGLKRPVTVCPRAGEALEYDLVCGQGRLEAFQKLGQTHVPAIVRDATSEERYLMSLVENIARRPPDSLDLVRGIADLEKRGYNPGQIAEKVGVTETYVRELLKLHAKGEEKLLAAVERGDLPITVAVQIASAKDGDVKRCLAEAFERGELEGKAIARARLLVERRLTSGKKKNSLGPGKHKRMSTDDLVKMYKRSMQKQAQLVKRARICESMLRLVCGALRDLATDEHFVTLLRAEKLDKMPKYLADQLKEKVSR
jgi:ParB family chromosome partitioning protein